MAAVTAAAIGTAGAVYSAKKSSDAQKAQNKMAKEGIEAADPFKQYRPKYAEQLDKLMSDPSSITSTPEYKARLEAAQRQLAAQGYTGSGNAIVEAANVGGQAYQQAFQNLSMLSGAGSATPGAGYDSALAANSEGNAQKLSAYAGVANNLGNLALTAGQRFNKTATTNTSGTSASDALNKAAYTPSSGKYG